VLTARAIAGLNGNVNPVSSNKSNEVAESIDADRGYVLFSGGGGSVERIKATK
jgi:hypothetical protein